MTFPPGGITPSVQPGTLTGRPRRRNREDTQKGLPPEFRTTAQPFLYCFGRADDLERMGNVPGRARPIGSEHLQGSVVLSQGFKANPPFYQTAYAKT
jgi:hypothetical protein